MAGEEKKKGDLLMFTQKPDKPDKPCRDALWLVGGKFYSKKRKKAPSGMKVVKQWRGVRMTTYNGRPAEQIYSVPGDDDWHAAVPYQNEYGDEYTRWRVESKVVLSSQTVTRLYSLGGSSKYVDGTLKAQRPKIDPATGAIAKGSDGKMEMEDIDVKIWQNNLSSFGVTSVSDDTKRVALIAYEFVTYPAKRSQKCIWPQISTIDDYDFTPDFDYVKMDAKCRQTGQNFAKYLKIHRTTSWKSVVSALGRYCSRWTCRDQPVTKGRTIGEDCFYERCGACRNRAMGFLLAAGAVGLKARYTVSDEGCHAWIAVYHDKNDCWYHINLGGCAPWNLEGGGGGGGPEPPPTPLNEDPIDPFNPDPEWEDPEDLEAGHQGDGEGSQKRQEILCPKCGGELAFAIPHGVVCQRCGWFKEIEPKDKDEDAPEVEESEDEKMHDDVEKEKKDKTDGDDGSGGGEKDDDGGDTSDEPEEGEDENEFDVEDFVPDNAVIYGPGERAIFIGGRKQ